MSQSPRLILASTSRYRGELLARLRLPFIAMPPHTDETPLPGEAPEALAQRLARAKAAAVAAREPGAVVIGSDQVALCDGAILGKPGNHERAREQLRRMSGRVTVFHTAVAVTDGVRTQTACIPTHCRLRQLDDAAIDAYLLAETPYDAAGSAKVEGLGIVLMAAIHSEDPTALIGLPLIALSGMLAAFGLDPLKVAA